MGEHLSRLSSTRYPRKYSIGVNPVQSRALLTLGEAPSLVQLAGLVVVLVGFRMTQRPG
jgi:hypothetical protein